MMDELKRIRRTQQLSKLGGLLGRATPVGLGVSAGIGLGDMFTDALTSDSVVDRRHSPTTGEMYYDKFIKPEYLFGDRQPYMDRDRRPTIANQQRLYPTPQDMRERFQQNYPINNIFDNLPIAATRFQRMGKRMKKKKNAGDAYDEVQERQIQRARERTADPNLNKVGREEMHERRMQRLREMLEEMKK